MSQLEKAIDRIKKCPKDYTYDELRYLMRKLGFEEYNKGKSSGSRVRFYRETDRQLIDLHKPHPKPEMDVAAVKMVKDFLEDLGDI